MGIWQSFTYTYLLPLLQIQKKLARIITFSQWDEPAQKLFVQLGWLNIYDIFKHKLKILAHAVGTNPSEFTYNFPDIKQTNNYSDHYLKNIAPSWPILSKPGDLFILRKTKTAIGKRAISNQIVSYWNNLEDKLRKTKHTTHFKKTLKKQLVYSPTLYRKYDEQEMEELTIYIADTRIKKKF